MSPFHPFLFPQPRVFSANHRFLSSLFSYSYKSLFPQSLYFHTHANPGGWGSSAVYLATRLPRAFMRRVTRHSPLPFYFQQVAASFALLALFFALPLFVFNRLQPLFAKCRGMGTPSCRWLGACRETRFSGNNPTASLVYQRSTCRGGPPSVDSVKCPVWEGEPSP